MLTVLGCPDWCSFEGGDGANGYLVQLGIFLVERVEFWLGGKQQPPVRGSEHCTRFLRYN